MTMVLEARPLEGEHVRLDLLGPDNREASSSPKRRSRDLDDDATSSSS